MDVDGSLVSFQMTFVFGSDGAVLTSGSTFRFRSRDALADSPVAAGPVIDEVRDAPDRPGPKRGNRCPVSVDAAQR